ncbi:MAG: peptide ABC transporter substrate-binding protein [Chloroflexi bacterium]|nr:peptide ABC transporter substrate-binding protein [Chloroflexota bacterium]
MSKIRMSYVLSFVIALSLVLSACAPASQPATSAPAVAGATAAPAATVAPAAAATEAPAAVPSAAPVAATGGRVVVLISEDMEIFNTYLSTATLVSMIAAAVIEPLVVPDVAGEYQPVLAERVPTEANGDVTDSGKTVTWHLRKDVKWSDGSPFTAADVLFTYAAASNKDSGSVNSSAYSSVKSVEATDDYTVVIKYVEFYSSFLDQFQWGILPASAGKAEEMLKWDYNRKPVGTGPFIFKEWVSGDHISLAKNPNYREAGKPYLDEVVFQIVPSQEVRVQMMLAGDAQVMMWPSASLRETWEKSDNVTLQLAPGIYMLRMFLNLSKPGDGDPGPTPPHPILGDERVRKALDLGINTDSIVTDLAQGRVNRITSPFAVGWYDCAIPGNKYDPEAAKAMLEEAGWKDTDGDGIREAHGAKYAKDGTLLSLSMTGYTGDTLLEQTGLVLVDMLKEIGVEIKLTNVEMSVLFGSWADKAPRKTGDYDILFYDTGAGINPQQHIANYFQSANIPTNENGGVGANYTRWADPKADALINEAGTTVDMTKRKALYCELGQIIHDSYQQLFIFQLSEGHAYSKLMTGYQVSTWGNMTWDVANWKLTK